MIGEKVPTSVRDRPGFRNGAGAEAGYVTWQHAGESWTMVHCDLDHQRFVDVVAGAVEFPPSSIMVPFDLDALPGGYGLSNITQDLSNGSTKVYFGVVDAAFGHADPDSVISLETGEFSVSNPPGRPTTINGRNAVLSEDRRTRAYASSSSSVTSA